MEVRRSPDLEQLGREAMAAVGRGDDAWLREHSATGQLVIAGSAPGEIVRGVDEVSASIASVRAANASAGVRAEPGEPEAYEAGDAGFVMSEGRFVFDDGSYVPTRTVVVLVRAADGWKMIGRFYAVTPSDDLVVAGSPITTPA